MKYKIKTLFVSLILVFSLYGQESKVIELVESVPSETVLDMSDIRNTQEVMLDMINKANRYIDIETFYISEKPQSKLSPILAALNAAAERGVKIRIVSDAVFYERYPETLDALNEKDNIEVRIIDFTEIAGGVMHAKYFIVDRRHLFVGSQNWDWRSLEHIRELGVRIHDHVISLAFMRLFNMDWKLAKYPEQKPVLEKQMTLAPVELLDKNRTVRALPLFTPENLMPYSNLWTEKHLLDLIQYATEFISLQLLTYSPTKKTGGFYPPLHQALIDAAGRGVRVRLLISDWSKRKPMIDYLKNLAMIENIEVKLSTIPESPEGHIPYARVDHCKYMVVDNERYWIGSANWSHSYFHQSRNAGLLIIDALTSRQVEAFFLNAWQSPYAYPVDPKVEYVPPIIGEKTNQE